MIKLLRVDERLIHGQLTWFRRESEVTWMDKFIESRLYSDSK